VIAGKHGPVGDDTVASVLREIYDAGIKPEWWELEPQPTTVAWANIDTGIDTHDPYCAGVVMLGLDAKMTDRKAGCDLVKTSSTVKGFAVGRSIFGHAAQAWLDGTMTDDEAIAEMTQRFASLVEEWDR